MDKKMIGALGERLVAEKYMQSGYKIIAMNYRTRFGEIDVAAVRDGAIAVIEVKTRQGEGYYSAKEAVTFSKQKKLKAAAASFISSLGKDDYFVRFDVAEVYDPLGDVRINIIENAFE